MHPIAFTTTGDLILGRRAMGPAPSLGNARALPRRSSVPSLPHSRRFSARRSQPCHAASADPDPDDYELGESDGYDSDDYEVLERAAAAPRPSGQPTGGEAPAAGPPTSRAASQFFFSGQAVARGLRRTEAKAAISNGFNLFLMFGATVDRCVSRFQAAAVVTGVAVLKFLGHGTRAGRRRAQIAHLKAQAALRSSPAGRTVDRWQQSVQDVQRQLPEDTWGKLLWLWDRPPVQRLRLTISMANLSFRLPALLALIATQVGLLASQVSLPMLAPLLLGTGMLLRSIKTNASFLFPRIGLVVVMLWLLWFANSVVQNTTAYLRKQGAIDQRLAGGVITVSECTTLLVALVVLLSMLGVNVSALLLPAGVAVAVAAKDLSHNFLAGFFLFVVQPFRVGDRVAVSSSAPGMQSSAPGSWFEGVAEKVDLRYTMIRQGRRRLMVPNSAFLTREFMVLEDGPAGEVQPPPLPGALHPQHAQHAYPHPHPQQQEYHQYLTQDNRHVWQYLEGPPVHQEVAAADSSPSAASGTGAAGGAPQANGHAGPQQQGQGQGQQQGQLPAATARGAKGAAPFAPSQHQQQQQQPMPRGGSGGPYPQYPPPPEQQRGMNGSGGPSYYGSSFNEQNGPTLAGQGSPPSPSGYWQPGVSGPSAYYGPAPPHPNNNGSNGHNPASHPLHPDAWQHYQGPGSAA